MTMGIGLRMVEGCFPSSTVALAKVGDDYRIVPGSWILRCGGFPLSGARGSGRHGLRLV